MMTTRWKHLWRKQRRRLLAAVVLLAYLGAIFGFPAPAAHANTDSRPFPCQGHVCGCQNADDCWRHCCCHSPSERLQWAADHDVTPPASVSADLGWRSERLRDQESPKSCCKKSAKAAPGHKNCCSTNEKPAQRGWIIGMSPFRCRGLSTLWVSAGIVLPPPVPSVWNPNLVLLDCLSQADATLAGIVPLPPDPPPRLSLG